MTNHDCAGYAWNHISDAIHGVLTHDSSENILSNLQMVRNYLEVIIKNEGVETNDGRFETKLQ